MISFHFKVYIVLAIGLLVIPTLTEANVPFKLPDTGQTSSYTSTPGEDADYIINPPSYTDNGDGTITDNITGLMWQKTDGGEMVFESTSDYCKNLSVGNYMDWRLPTSIELFSINFYSRKKPALDTFYFTKTAAEYWWTGELCVDDASKVWVVNAGGGIGAHPKSETVSAGGSKKIHIRAVRNLITLPNLHFAENGDGAITDNFTGLIWQKIQAPNTMTWEEALTYAKNTSLAGKSDWRLPNIKELQSLSDVKLKTPSFNKTYFSNMTSGNYWSSTTLQNTEAKAWDINVDYGLVSYNDKTTKENVLLVRGGIDDVEPAINESLIPGGEFEMGDHFGFSDPKHPSDELPLHTVKVDSLYMSKTETTNLQYLDFLNSSLTNGLIEVRNNAVYKKGSSDIYCYTNQFASYYSIGYDGTRFSIVDFRANHPIVGVMWLGAAAYCNWLSLQNGLAECYNLTSWACDFTKSGYRLPTEAEWEYSARGGHTNPYYNYPWGNEQDKTKANWPESKDPYEGTSESSYPHTTPVSFYDGSLRLKSEFNWPGAANSYQTSDGANGFGLYDMAGNVWEFVNDWYGQKYYEESPYDNPKGPETGFLMPDGKAYRGMRGGNWYNGYKLTTDTVNDGHSRVSNRNPSYYRGPQDPNHPWYHIGFRVVRKYSTASGIWNDKIETGKIEVFPNPFNNNATISIQIDKTEFVNISVVDFSGREVAQVHQGILNEGSYKFLLDGTNLSSGLYSLLINTNNGVLSKNIIILK
ncbi:MAG: DUF1566 domain-containing protein [bacterium]